MIEEIFNKDALLEKAKSLSHKEFKHGFDGMSMDGAYTWMYINYDRLRRDIINGAYRPMPATGFRRAKINGGFCQLSRLTAIDTVLQSVLNDRLAEEVDGHFAENSFAYRSGKGVLAALECYVAYSNKYKLASKLDFNACFDNMDHGVLEQAIKRFFQDEKLCSLIMIFVKTPVWIDGEVVENEKGLLQGMPLAPLLCNIYFHLADEFMQSIGVEFIRFADDIVLFGDSFSELKMKHERVVSFIEKELHLKLNGRKSKIDSPVKMSFLGHRFDRDKRGVIAFDSGIDTKAAYHNWHTSKPKSNGGRVDILSDGVLRQKELSVLFDTDTVDTSIPLVGTERINVYSDVVFDTGFLSLAMKKGISVNLFDKSGYLIGSFVPAKPLKTPKITHEQLLAYYDSKKRLAIAKEFVLASVHNTLLNVRYHNKQSENEAFKGAINDLAELKLKIKSAATYEALLLLEAKCRSIYYGCFDAFIKREDFIFESRTRRPPKNKVNALISFGNTVLYGHISHEIQKTALDVRVGYLHATNTRYCSLNLDIAEIFKPLVVDRVIFALINKGEITSGHFSVFENGAVYLNEDGKRVFLSAFYEKLETTLDVKGTPKSYNALIVEEVRKLIKSLRDGEKYKAFRQVR